MAEEVKNESTVVPVEDTVKKIKDLQTARGEVASLNEELTVHQKDLVDAEILHGVSSKEYGTKKDIVELTLSKITEAEKKVSELTMKKSEIKPTLDEITKKFEEAYRTETTKEYHIELTEFKENDKNRGKKIFKQLMEYLNYNVRFTPKTAGNLMMLTHDMKENNAWVQSKDFDNIIILRASSVMSLYRFIMDDMEGKGFLEAKKFLECWAHCGQSVANAIREIQKDNKISREIASDLNLVEEEFNRSEDDLPHNEEEMTTQEEVAPDVSE